MKYFWYLLPSFILYLYSFISVFVIVFFTLSLWCKFIEKNSSSAMFTNVTQPPQAQTRHLIEHSLYWIDLYLSYVRTWCCKAAPSLVSIHPSRREFYINRRWNKESCIASLSTILHSQLYLLTVDPQTAIQINLGFLRQ